jgi:hypothetical protein
MPLAIQIQNLSHKISLVGISRLKTRKAITMVIGRKCSGHVDLLEDLFFLAYSRLTSQKILLLFITMFTTASH